MGCGGRPEQVDVSGGFNEDGSPPPGKHRQARRLAKSSFWTAVVLAGFIIGAGGLIDGVATRLAEIQGIIGTIFTGLFGIGGLYLGITNTASQFK